MGRESTLQRAKHSGAGWGTRKERKAKGNKHEQKKKVGGANSPGKQGKCGESAKGERDVNYRGWESVGKEDGEARRDQPGGSQTTIVKRRGSRAKEENCRTNERDHE